MVAGGRAVRAALVAAVLCGCNQAPAPAPLAPSVPSPSPSPLPVPGPATMAFADALAARMPDVHVGETVAHEAFPFLDVPGVRITAAGESVFVFEFASSSLAEATAARISPDGKLVGAAHVDWISTPHFYRSGTLLVLYVGQTPELLRALEEILGPQVAGGA